jgi:branched-chain amino acid transport system permease protein
MTMDLNAWFNSNELFIQSTVVSIVLACSVQVALRAGIFSLASVGFYQASTYASGYLVTQGWPIVPTILAAMAGSALGGWVLARILVRLQGLYLAMATIAFDLMVGVVALNWTSVTGGAIGMYGIPATISFGAMVVVLVVVVAGLALLERGAIGRMFDMCREDPQVSMTSGVNPQRLQRMAFVLSAALGSLAGCLHALSFNAISPGDVDFNFLIMTLAMVIIGGAGSWRGAALGAILVVWVPLELRFLDTRWPIVYGAAMLLVASYAPDGLTGAIGRLSGVLRRRRRAPMSSAVEGVVAR